MEGYTNFSLLLFLPTEGKESVDKSAFIRTETSVMKIKKIDEAFTSVTKPLKLQPGLPYKVYISREMKTITGLSNYIRIVLLIVLFWKLSDLPFCNYTVLYGQWKYRSMQ